MINYILNVDEEIEDKEMIMMKIQRCSLLLLAEEETGVYIRVHQVVRDVIKTVIKDYLASHRLDAVNGAVTIFNRFIEDNLGDNWHNLDSTMQSNSIAQHLKTLVEITLQKKLGPEHVHVATTYSYLGSVHRDLGDFEQAKKNPHHALNIRLKQLGHEHVDVAATYGHLGYVHRDLGDFEQAKEYNHHALKGELKPKSNIC
ncbi:hypothetical protein OS493_038208, partial [Desmophyllum pertusum]